MVITSYTVSGDLLPVNDSGPVWPQFMGYVQWLKPLFKSPFWLESAKIGYE